MNLTKIRNWAIFGMIIAVLVVTSKYWGPSLQKTGKSLQAQFVGSTDDLCERDRSKVPAPDTKIRASEFYRTSRVEFHITSDGEIQGVTLIEPGGSSRSLTSKKGTRFDFASSLQDGEYEVRVESQKCAQVTNPKISSTCPEVCGEPVTDSKEFTVDTRHPEITALTRFVIEGSFVVLEGIARDETTDVDQVCFRSSCSGVSKDGEFKLDVPVSELDRGLRDGCELRLVATDVAGQKSPPTAVDSSTLFDKPFTGWVLLDPWNALCGLRVEETEPGVGLRGLAPGWMWVWYESGEAVFWFDTHPLWWRMFPLIVAGSIAVLLILGYFVIWPKIIAPLLVVLGTRLERVGEQEQEVVPAEVPAE